MRYGNIHELFQPIFEWIKEHYPSGGFFIVDRNAAKFYAGKEDLDVYDKETVESVQKSIKIANSEEAKKAFERFNQRAKENGQKV